MLAWKFASERREKEREETRETRKKRPETSPHISVLLCGGIVLFERGAIKVLALRVVVTKAYSWPVVAFAPCMWAPAREQGLIWNGLQKLDAALQLEQVNNKTATVLKTEKRCLITE